VIGTFELRGSRHGLLLAGGLLLGVALAAASAGGGLGWEAGAGGLGIGLAALVGLANTCSA